MTGDADKVQNSYDQLAGLNYLPHLRAWRAYCEKGASELADEAGISRAALYNLETQRARATFSTVRKLARALRLKPRTLVFFSPDQLFSADDEPGQGEEEGRDVA